MRPGQVIYAVNVVLWGVLFVQTGAWWVFLCFLLAGVRLVYETDPKVTP